MNTLAVGSGIKSLCWYMLLKLLRNVLFQGHRLWCFYHPGKCAVAEMIVFLVIFFENGKLLPSLLSLLLGLIMRNCEDY